MMKGLDSAFGPTLAQAKAALADGYQFWGWYLGGAGAYHSWTDAEVAVLAEAGFTQSLPIWVPDLNLTGVPAIDATRAVNRLSSLGWQSVIVLDTEASMRGNPHLHSYVDGFVAELRNLGVTPVVYGGGNYVPAGVNAWWILQGIPPAGTAYQWGSGSLAGISVDYDTAGPGFPMASLTAPTPVPIEPTKEELMSVFVAPDGTRIIERVAPPAPGQAGGHLLVFERAPATLANPNPKYTVDDVTDEIAAANPGIPLFLVQA